MIKNYSNLMTKLSAFGRHTNAWTGIDQKLIENKSLPDQPLYSLVPTIVNNNDHSRTNDDDIPLPISIAIDDYGYVKPSASQSFIIS